MLHLTVRVCLVLQETIKLVSKVAVPFIYSYQQFMRVSVAPNLCQHLVLSVLGIWAILMDVYWYFNSYFPDDMWSGASFHIFIATVKSSLVRCLLRSLVHFFNQVVCFLIVEC